MDTFTTNIYSTRDLEYLQFTCRFQLLWTVDFGNFGLPALQVIISPSSCSRAVIQSELTVTFPSGLVWKSKINWLVLSVVIANLQKELNAFSFDLGGVLIFKSFTGTRIREKLEHLLWLLELKKFNPLLCCTMNNNLISKNSLGCEDESVSCHLRSWHAADNLFLISPPGDVWSRSGTHGLTSHLVRLTGRYRLLDPQQADTGWSNYNKRYVNPLSEWPNRDKMA